MPPHPQSAPTSPRFVISLLSVSLYLGSMVAPYDSRSSYGFGIFLVGLVFCWMIHATFAWWANVLFWVALGYFCAGRRRAAAIWGLSATALALTWLVLQPEAITSPAFQFWVGSMAVLGFGALQLATPANNSKEPAPYSEGVTAQSPESR